MEAGIPRQLAFPVEEYRIRLGRVQAAMAERGLELLLIHTPENICYLTGYQTSGYFEYQVLAVPAAGAPRLLVRHFERLNVDAYAWLPGAATWTDRQDPIDATVRLLVEMGGTPPEVGVEERSWFLTVEQHRALAVRLRPSRLVDASGLVDRIRTIKSAAEIAVIRRAAQIAEAGFRAALATAGDSVSELQVAAAVHHAEILAGCEYPGMPHFISSGYRNRLAHANWSPKIMRRGEILYLDISGCVARYHAAVRRSIVIGEPTAEHRQIADLIVAAQDAAIAAMRPGVPARDIDTLIRAPLVRSGLAPNYAHSQRTAYGLGICFPPRRGELPVLEITDTADWALQPGMVFHVIAAVQGIGFNEMVAVQPDSAERLTTLPRDLAFVP